MKVLSSENSFPRVLFYKYKIHFFLFWVLLFVAQTYKSTVEQPLRPVVLANLAELGSSAIFAFTVLFLFRPLLEKNRKKLFILLTVILLLLCGFLSSYLVFLIVLDLGVSYARADYWLRIPGETIYTFLVASSFGFVKIADDYFREKARSEELKREKLHAELEFLKAQINPHFLFNTLNNLYFLIEKEPKSASKHIIQLSDILRYQIYETNSDTASMAKEIENIKNYIELERIRKDNIIVDFKIKGNPGVKTVLPNILLPLIENAFKHLAIQRNGSCFVGILIEESGGNMNFEVKNSSAPVQENNSKGLNGLGIVNLRRRLDLFYPGKHSIEIENNTGKEMYEVKLKLFAEQI